ncbi:MAG: hypothetical protein TU35_005155 [Thermoproteus sp. AZ2]|jgi:hypothetical protein|uniref:Uncharacterized protein n=1 Tax=Thermoproteus sp. AZ2 TaxID=1609232 RepID=A0ACC6V0Z0_9CREN
MRNIVVTVVSDAIDALLRQKRQEVITSEDLMKMLKMTRLEVSDAELRKALMLLELYGKIYVKKIRKENREIYQIIKRK